MIVKLKKYQEITTLGRTTSKKLEWKEKDLWAINVIYSRILNDQLQFVKDRERTYEIMKKFNEMYLKISTALQIYIKNKLEKVKLKDFENSSIFFAEYEILIKIIWKWKWESKLGYIEKVLPKSLTFVRDSIDQLRKKDQTVHYVKGKIKMFELREQEKGSKSKSNVFRIERKREKTCFTCGKIRQFKAQCFVCSSKLAIINNNEKNEKAVVEELNVVMVAALIRKAKAIQNWIIYMIRQ